VATVALLTTLAALVLGSGAARGAYPVAGSGKIVYAAGISPTSVDVIIADPDGSNPVNLTSTAHPGFAEHPQLSPNGRQISPPTAVRSCSRAAPGRTTSG
jgi:hypothetical protein